jgi:hypothetical protein
VYSPKHVVAVYLNYEIGPDVLHVNILRV